MSSASLEKEHPYSAAPRLSSAVSLASDFVVGLVYSLMGFLMLWFQAGSGLPPLAENTEVA